MIWTTDRRRIEGREDPEGERLLRDAADAYLEAKIRTARALRRIDEAGTFHLRGCSSAVQYAVRLGIPAADARMLLGLALVLDEPVAVEAGPPPRDDRDDRDAAREAADGVPAPGPRVEDLVRCRSLPVENAALVAQVMAQPGLVRPGDDWLGRAGTLTTPALRRLVNERIEESAHGTRSLIAVTLNVTPRSRDDFSRARDLASREAGTRLSGGQTFALVVDRYLDAHDELRRGAGTRRIGPTSAIPGERYVPAAVRREVLERSGDRCEVPSCTFRTFLDFAHVEAHAAGGSREASNLLRLCSVHHTQFDAGLIEFAGWSEGRPLFRTRREVPARAPDPVSALPPSIPTAVHGGSAPRDARNAFGAAAAAGDADRSDRDASELPVAEDDRRSFVRALMAELEARGDVDFGADEWTPDAAGSGQGGRPPPDRPAHGDEFCVVTVEPG